MTYRGANRKQKLLFVDVWVGSSSVVAGMGAEKAIVRVRKKAL